MMTQAVLSDSQRSAIEEELRACLAGCDAAADNADADGTTAYYATRSTMPACEIGYAGLFGT